MPSTTRWLLGLFTALTLLAPARADEPTTPEERQLDADAKKFAAAAAQLRRQGRPADAVVRYRQNLETLEKLFPASRYPDGHPDLAAAIHRMSGMLWSMGQAEQALPYSRRGLEMRQKLFPAEKYPDGHPSLTASLNDLGIVLKLMGQPEQALPYFRQNLAMMRTLYPASKYPDGHPGLANSIGNVGVALRAMGHAEQALPYFRENLAMRQKLYPPSKYPDGHTDLAAGLNSLGSVLHEMGQAAEALAVFRQALAMRQKLFPASKYPDGHADLATSLDNLGVELHATGQAEPALDHFRQGLAMKRTLYPPARYPAGHPELATSLDYVSTELQVLGRAAEALPFARDSLAMNQALYPAARYPNGHPDLAAALGNLGVVLESLGRLEEALAALRQGLEMNQKLYPAAAYPDGHPRLANSVNNTAGTLLAMGQADQAAPLFRQAFEMQQRLLRRELATASEEAAFDKVAAQALFRDAYLTATRALAPAGDPAYGAVWPARAVATRLLEHRQATARAAGAGARLDRLRDLRRQTERLLLDGRLTTAERDRRLAAVADERDRVERELVAEVPALRRWRDLDALGPADLARALPRGAVFIDLIRYTRFDWADNKRTRTPCYAAFVVAADRPTRRVELGEAQAIDAAVHAWRSDIDARRPSAAAGRLGADVWGALAPHLPPGTTTLYFAADGDLARVPWAALPLPPSPGSAGEGAGVSPRVLLEDHAVAQVPHGTYLLEQLKFGRRLEGPESLLTVGGVAYGAGRWPALPGTAAEVQAIATLAPVACVAASGADATAAWVVQRLPAARWAHLATHGEFKAGELTADRTRAAAALASPRLGGDVGRVAAKNPLGYVGLVLANGEVLSGLGIVDLPLQNTQLVTLSACETGLGELTGGEGVHGLQRAFHLAGCPNVVASLWRVDDAATAALMAKFYHELWVNKRPPAEALREAQLTIYRRPELIPDLAGDRGAPRLKQAVAGTAGVEPSGRRGTADTKLWAAFVLSGVGR